MLKRFIGIIVLASVVAVGWIGVASSATSSPKVNICHRTNSVSNPYNFIQKPESSVNDANGTGPNDHLGHLGLPFNFGASDAPGYDTTYPKPRNGDQWGDIIPPFYENGDPRPDPTLTLNWTIEGQAIFYAECVKPAVPPTTQPTVPPTTQPTNPPRTQPTNPPRTQPTNPPSNNPPKIIPVVARPRTAG